MTPPRSLAASRSRNADAIRETLRAERGDFQTPLPIAEAALDNLGRIAGGLVPQTILEPTCGVGAFLRAAERRWPDAERHGWDLSDTHLNEARRALFLPARLRLVDVFSLSWADELERLAEPIWIIGNPPWVTVSKLGALDGNTHLERRNVDGLTGWQARTGAANFDVSEWLLRRWLQALAGRRFVIAVICKTQVARRLMEVCVRERWGVHGRVFGVNARQAFGVAVSAVWLVLEPAHALPSSWPVYPDLQSHTPSAHMGLRDGHVVVDVIAFDATADMFAREPVPWRSGIKHDAADVMELHAHATGLQTKAGARVALEPLCVHPLLKGTDLFHGRLQPTRALLVPQTRVGESTDRLRTLAPETWAYLDSHRARLAARRSRIYSGQPDFAVFGVGPYTFSAWKVAVSGLHAEPRFRAVGPVNGRAVVFDDTCYVLPMADEAQARAAEAFLNGPRAQQFLKARSFADAKRPVTQRLLAQLAVPAGV